MAPLDDALAVMARARRVTVLTGAGISTDSGIPDFRGPQGVWTKNPAAERTSTLQDYLADPDVRRQAWQNRLQSPTWAARPNAGHAALADLERQGRLVAVLTQNIDELHQRAGNSPELVLELHGTMHEAVCWTCGWRGPMQPVLDRVRAGDEDPSCVEDHGEGPCRGVIKSATISFGQALDEGVMIRARQAAEACDAFLAIGSTLSVYPAAGLVPWAKDAGAAVVIVNAHPTPFDRLADAVVNASISDVLPALVAAGDPR